MTSISPETYLPIISGEDRSLKARGLRLGLSLVSLFYGLAMWLRNRAYDRGWFPTLSVPVPVISVGNLTLGGTGKTPLVAWLARWFRQRQVRVAIISRGYGATEGSRNDEAKVLELALPDVPHLQNADRLAAARTAILELESELLILDDAFQHRRLKRDLDIVLIDALQPFGFGHLFPRGLLREPLGAIRRAHIVLLSRADLITPTQREQLREKIARIHPNATWAEIAHQPVAWVNAQGERLPLEALSGQTVAAFCGIGNPQAFQRTLQQLDLNCACLRLFPDHHPYTRDDVLEITRWLQGTGASAAVCTEKDLVKIGLPQLGPIPLWALRVEVNFLAGLPNVERHLDFLAKRLNHSASASSSRPA